MLLASRWGRLPMLGERIHRLVKTSSLATLFPGYFAFVMATGIVSLAAHFHGREWIALGLFQLNVGAYLVLWCLTLIRFAYFRQQFIGDLTHHLRGATFLTKSAGTCVLASQFAILTPWMTVAKVLWFFGFGLWAALSYTFLTVVVVRDPKPLLEAGINGGWLLIIVATESICVLGTLVAPAMASTELILFISLAMYLVGAMLYVFFTTLILYRWLFFTLKPAQLTPDYWINMGALAITTLAGTRLLQDDSRWPLLQTLTPFLTGSALLFWAVATWWIPLLLILVSWRHLQRKVPLQYTPEYWALVFPLGMYSVATFMLGKVTGLTFLGGLAECFAYVALIAWAIIFTGMILSLARLFRSRFRNHLQP